MCVIYIIYLYTYIQIIHSCVFEIKFCLELFFFSPFFKDKTLYLTENDLLIWRILFGEVKIRLLCL